MSVFAAFEYECHACREVYEIANDDSLKQIKNMSLNALDDITHKDMSDEEKNFIAQAKERTSQLGTQFGQTKRIENAYSVLENALKGSIEHILWRLKQREPIKKLIHSVAMNLSKLRGKIVHGELNAELSEIEQQYIQFLDILTYAQMLRRAGVPDDGIELIIDAVFYCNFCFGDYLKDR